MQKGEKDKHNIVELNYLAELETLPPPVCTSERLSWRGFRLERHRISNCAPTPDKFYTSHVVALTLDGKFKNDLPVIGGKRDISYRRNEILLYPAGLTHVGYDPQEMDLLAVYLEPDFIERAARDLIGGERVELVPRFKLDDPFVENFIRFLLTEAETGECGSLYAESLATALAIRLVKNHSAAKLVLLEYGGGLPKYKLRRVVEYINESLDGELPLSTLAAVCELSVYHFARQFKQSTGATPHQFVLRRKIERAKRLLTETNSSVAEIAFRLGFADQSHFTKLFFSVTGATPKTYKNQS